jgi:hypothetical protein
MNAFPEYHQYEKLIYSAIRSVHAQIGGDLQEMLACSGMLFVKACLCYNETRGMQIGAWIRKVAWDDTYSARRTDLTRSKYYCKGEVDLTEVADKRSGFSLQEFMDDLSEDARNLVELALNPVDILLTHEGVPKKASFKAKARRMYQWSDEQISELWQEVCDAL